MAEGSDPGDSPSTVRCPVCDGEFVQTQVRGVTIDVCEDHGMWLDAGELDTILAKQKRNQAFIKNSAVKRARREGKASALAIGWLSLFAD